MIAEDARAVAARLVEYLETGVAPAGLFAPAVVSELVTPGPIPNARGLAATLELRRAGHPWPGSVPRWRCDPTTTGFVVEVEERWRVDDREWWCRELIRAEVEGSAITAITVYCTGDRLVDRGDSR